MSFSNPWRPYQREADEQINFTFENKKLVKMFCFWNANYMVSLFSFIICLITSYCVITS